MDFTFSAEQDALRDAVRDVHGATGPRAADVRAMVDGDASGSTGVARGRRARLDRRCWSPRSRVGSVSASWMPWCVLEEMGRVPFPGPYLSSAIDATIAARRLGRRRPARGPRRRARSGHGRARGARATATRRRGSAPAPARRVRQWVLDGQKPLVLDGPTARLGHRRRPHAGRASARSCIERPDIEVVPSDGPDPRVGRLELDETPARPVGPPVTTPPIWQRIADDSRSALAAELIGVCDAVARHGDRATRRRGCSSTSRSPRTR